MDIKELEKKLYSEFFYDKSVLPWEQAYPDTRDAIQNQAKAVAVMIIEANLEQLTDVRDRSTDRWKFLVDKIADLEQQKKEILGK